MFLGVARPTGGDDVVDSIVAFLNHRGDMVFREMRHLAIAIGATVVEGVLNFAPLGRREVVAFCSMLFGAAPFSVDDKFGKIALTICRASDAQFFGMFERFETGTQG